MPGYSSTKVLVFEYIIVHIEKSPLNKALTSCQVANLAFVTAMASARCGFGVTARTRVRLLPQKYVPVQATSYIEPKFCTQASKPTGGNQLKKQFCKPFYLYL